MLTACPPVAVIEQLPMDLRDRFTEMREMDLQVQSEYTVTGSLPEAYRHITAGVTHRGGP